MFEQLKNYKSSKIIVELANGRQIAGIVAAVNQQDIRLETDEGNCVVLVSAIQVVWENMTRALQLRTAGEDSVPLGTQPPCFMAYTAPCTQAFTQPCCQPFYQPCPASYTQPCPQPPCPDPCFERYGYSGHHCLERFYGQHHPNPHHPYPYPPYPYPPYPPPYPPPPYPPYPYPPYPPHPYPYTGEQGAGGLSQQAQTSTTGNGADGEKDASD